MLGLAESVLVYLFEETRPVANRCVHEAAMDEVEFTGIGPVCLHVIDLKANVWRNPENFSSKVLNVTGEETRQYHRG